MVFNRTKTDTLHRQTIVYLRRRLVAAEFLSAV